MRSTPGPTSAAATIAMLIRTMGLAILIGMALVPPWQTTYSLNGQKQSVSAGYHPLWNPPADEVEVSEGTTDPAHRINVIRLGIQLVAALAIMNGSLWLLKRSEP